jgi:hypothetical protein
VTQDNNQDRSQTEGQEGIARETELRNRENETGQAQNQPATDRSGGQAQNQPTTDQSGGQASTGQANPEGFVGSDSDDSSDYLTKGEEKQDFAPQGQGAEDIETGQSSQRDAELDDGSANSN